MNKELINLLNNRLIERLLDDLQDDTKCTPGLYTVARGIVNDNREALDGISHNTLDILESAMRSKMPFKFKSETI